MKKIFVFAIALMLLSFSLANAFAETESIPLKLSVTDNGIIKIDVNVYTNSGQTIEMSAEALSDNLVIEDVYIKNNSMIVGINVDSISVTKCNDNWKMISLQEDFKRMSTNEKAFGIGTENWDFSNGSYNDPNIYVSPNSQTSISFIGKISPITENVEHVNIANTTLTLSMVIN